MIAETASDADGFEEERKQCRETQQSLPCLCVCTCGCVHVWGYVHVCVCTGR